MTTDPSIEGKLAAMSPRRRGLVRKLLTERGVDVAGLFGPTRSLPDGTSTDGYLVAYIGDGVFYPEAGEWAAHHTAIVAELSDRVDAGRLDEALTQVFERHGLAAPTLVGESGSDVTAAPFPTDGPLIRAGFANDRRGLVLCGHDLVVDPRSLRLLAREVLTRYATGRSPTQRPLRFADVRRWRERNLADGGFAGQLEYWRTALKDLPSRSSSTRSKAGRRVDVPLTEEDFDSAAEFARTHGYSELTVWAAVWGLAVRRDDRDDPVVIGCCLSGRNFESMEEVVGPMANPIFLPFDLRSSPSFLDVAAQAQALVTHAVRNSDVPIEVVLAQAAPHLAFEDVRLVTIGYIDDPEESFVSGSLSAVIRDLYLGYAKETLRLEVTAHYAFIEFRLTQHTEAAVFELAQRVRAILRERIRS